MAKKNTVKRIVDILMTIGLLFLMAYQVTGETYHEWIGAGMLLIFILHNALNLPFYKALFHGKYTAVRVLRAILNLAVLLAILFTGYSGIVMSNHVFFFLHLNTGMSFARQMHLSGSYWAFVLMSMHLGLHWSMVANRLTPKEKGNPAFLWICRAAAFLLALYGAVRFYQADIYTYMLMKTHFAFLDYEKAAVMVLFENLAMMSTWISVGYYGQKGLALLTARKKNKRQGIVCLLVVMALFLSTILNLTGAQKDNEFGMDWGSQMEETAPQDTTFQDTTETENTDAGVGAESVTENFVLIPGGTFTMGSPESENWRGADETEHTVTVSDFYMSIYEVTQEEYEAVTGDNPSSFSGGNLPVEGMTWLEAVEYCNARSEQEGLSPAYQIQGEQVLWNRGADGYRLPTEAEWEYACRAGTTTPFNTETSISAEEANYYGHYPYEIEENYFSQENLATEPGQYRETTVAVDSFAPNGNGLYNMHGNVSEWVWDYYGAYDTGAAEDPTGPVSGSLRVYRGGGWNDFAKNMRSAYRATLEQDLASFNIGIRLVRNASGGAEDIVGGETVKRQAGEAGQVLIAYFSWGGNTRGVAEEIQAQTNADIFEITLVEPYSDDYNTVLEQAQHDQNVQARPKLADHIDNMDEYETILLGYPNWWASIPMPIASFLEEYDFAGKTIIPFCSHGGGRFGQSQTAIAKLAPDAVMGEGLSIHYSGGASLSADVAKWLEQNGIETE